MSKLKVKESLISTLDIGETKKFGESLVTALDANHCPGSVMFLIQLTSGQTFPTFVSYKLGLIQTLDNILY